MLKKIILPRRKFIQQTGIALVGSCFLPKIVFGSTAAQKVAEKALHLYQIHTGEFYKDVFWSEGKLIPESVKKLNKFLRDWYTNETTEMSHKLFDLLHSIQDKIDGKQPLTV